MDMADSQQIPGSSGRSYQPSGCPVCIRPHQNNPIGENLSNNQNNTTLNGGNTRLRCGSSLSHCGFRVCRASAVGAAAVRPMFQASTFFLPAGGPGSFAVPPPALAFSITSIRDRKYRWRFSSSARS